MSTRDKLLSKLLGSPRDFTWDEATTLMSQCNFKTMKKSGSRRTFRHTCGAKVFIHEPHPRNTLLKYAVEAIIDGLKAAGEIE